MNIRNHRTGEIVPLYGDVRADHPSWVYEQCLEGDGLPGTRNIRLQNMLDQYDISEFADNDWARDVCGITYDQAEIDDYNAGRERLAETQTQINGPYVPTHKTLRECWDIDLGSDVDGALLRENATSAEVGLLQQVAIVRGEVDGADDDLAGVALELDELDRRLMDYLTERIWDRVQVAGRYVRDSKWTREA